MAEIPRFTSIAEADAWLAAYVPPLAPHQYGELDEIGPDSLGHLVSHHQATPGWAEGNCRCICDQCQIMPSESVSSDSVCICPYGCAGIPMNPESCSAIQGRHSHPLPEDLS